MIVEAHLLVPSGSIARQAQLHRPPQTTVHRLCAPEIVHLVSSTRPLRASSPTYRALDLGERSARGLSTITSTSRRRSMATASRRLRRSSCGVPARCSRMAVRSCSQRLMQRWTTKLKWSWWSASAQGILMCQTLCLASPDIHAPTMARSGSSRSKPPNGTWERILMPLGLSGLGW